MFRISWPFDKNSSWNLKTNAIKYPQQRKQQQQQQQQQFKGALTLYEKSIVVMFMCDEHDYEQNFFHMRGSL